MSKRQVRGRNRMPDYWEWSCDLCGKTEHTNSAATRPAGWLPKGRTVGDHHHDFCSPEHEAEFNNPAKETPAAPAKPAEPEETKTETETAATEA